jgi:hypothetical protein
MSDARPPAIDVTAIDVTRIMPLAGLLGVETVAQGPAEVRLRLAWSPETCTAGGASCTAGR